MGRKALPPGERNRRELERRQQRIQEHHRLMSAGLCRQCGEPRSDQSKIFCDKHLARHRETCSAYKEDAVSRKCRRLKSSASQRKIPFEMTKDEFVDWFKSEVKECCYCGIKESELSSHSDAKQRNLTVDRRNNNEAYNQDNICLACFRCNNMKSNFFTSDEWLGIATNIIRPRLREYHSLDK